MKVNDEKLEVLDDGHMRWDGDKLRLALDHDKGTLAIRFSEARGEDAYCCYQETPEELTFDPKRKKGTAFYRVRRPWNSEAGWGKSYRPSFACTVERVPYDARERAQYDERQRRRESTRRMQEDARRREAEARELAELDRQFKTAYVKNSKTSKVIGAKEIKQVLLQVIDEHPVMEKAKQVVTPPSKRQWWENCFRLYDDETPDSETETARWSIVAHRVRVILETLKRSNTPTPHCDYLSDRMLHGWINRLGESNIEAQLAKTLRRRVEAELTKAKHSKKRKRA